MKQIKNNIIHTSPINPSCNVINVNTYVFIKNDSSIHFNVRRLNIDQKYGQANMNNQSIISDGREKDTYFVTPNDIINTLPTDKNYCLFLDIDGTLAPFQIHPEHSFIPNTTLEVIKKIIELNIPVIAVTGRDVETASKLLQSIELPIAGLHGLDIYFDSDTYIRPDLSDINFQKLKEDIINSCEKYPDLLIEDKGHSIALHYRKTRN